MPAALSRQHFSLIAVARKALAMDEDDYRAILQRIAGVGSARELDACGFELLMREFRRLGFQSEFSKANLGNRPGMATPAQVAAIRALWSQFTNGEGTDAQLGKWLDSKFKVSALRFLPASKCSKVIHALTKMVENRRRE